MLISRFKAVEAAGDPPILTAMDRRVVRPWMTRGRMMVGAAMMLTAIAGSFVYVRYGLTSFIAVSAQQLDTAQVQRGMFHEFIPLSGTLVPRTTVYLDAVAGGQVAAVMVEEGAMVQTGDPLVILKNAALELDVAGREAALAQQLYQLTTINLSLDDRRLQRSRELTEIDFQIRQAISQLKRKRPLLLRGYVSRNEIDDLERNLARYRSTYDNVKAAQAADDAARPQQVAQLNQSIALISNNLAMTRRNLDALTIKAPLAGQLTLLDADIGAAKVPGQRIGQIDSAEGFKVRANVAEFYLPRLQSDQHATAEIEGRDYDLVIAKIYPEVKDRQFAVDFRFTAEVQDLPTTLRRGQTLQLKLEVGETRESLMVANGEYYDDAGGTWVFVVSPSGGSAVRRTVTLGRRNPESIEILKGLADGERIITSSYASFRDIERIDILGTLNEGE